MKWNTLEVGIPEWKGKFIWSLEPTNWVARLLYRHIKFIVHIDYLQALETRKFGD